MYIRTPLWPFFVVRLVRHILKLRRTSPISIVWLSPFSDIRCVHVYVHVNGRIIHVHERSFFSFFAPSRAVRAVACDHERQQSLSIHVGKIAARDDTHSVWARTMARSLNGYHPNIQDKTLTSTPPPTNDAHNHRSPATHTQIYIYIHFSCCPTLAFF